MKKQIKILTEKELSEELKKIPGWEKRGNKIAKEFKFADFMDSLNFINAIAPFCEKIDHHPDAHIFYSRVLFELTRYDVGEKITNHDIAVAKEIERLYNEKQESA